MNPIRVALFAISFCVLILSSRSHSSQNTSPTISTEEQTAQDTTEVPCKVEERLNAVKALFTKMGAQTEEITIEKRDGVENVIVRKQGQGQGIIVIGAHYDKAHEGCGAIDNWTGIVALAHTYRSLKNVPLQKTFIFVGFGKEEQGLLGSKAMVRKIKKEELDQYCAMINIDSLGLAAPQVAQNLSSATLVTRTTELAQRMKMPFSYVNIPGASADSVPFIEKKIPAVTICALLTGWGKILHTSRDQVKEINPSSVYLGYRLALALVVELDGLACEVSREDVKAKSP